MGGRACPGPLARRRASCPPSLASSGTTGVRGKLGEGVLPGLLRDAYAGRKSGFLGFVREEETCGLHIVGGHIVCGEAGPPELRIGEVLVAEGILSRAALERALEAKERAAKRLGEILEEQGVVDAEEVEYGLGLQVRAILARVFSWKGGTYVFDEALTSGEARDHPRLASTGEMILEAARLVRDPEAVRYGLGELDRVLLLATDPLLRFQRVTLNATDGFVLSRVDGTLTAREILQVTPLPGTEVERSLFGLVCTGMVEFVSPVRQDPQSDSDEAIRREILQAYERRSTRTDAEVLGVAPDARPAEIRAAYLRLAKRYHPDAHHRPGLADLQQHLAAIFTRVGSAYEALSRREARRAGPGQASVGSPAAAPPPAPAPAAPAPAPAEGGARDAESLFRKAEERYGAGKYWEAVALLEETRGLAQGLLRNRARLLLTRIYLRYPEATKQAEKELQALIEEVPDHVEAHVLLGTLYKQTGLAARASAMFRRALELSPGHRAAQAELEALTVATPVAAPEAAKGLLKKLFGKR